MLGFRGVVLGFKGLVLGFRGVEELENASSQAGSWRVLWI